MRPFIVVILLFSLTCCKDAADMERDIKTLSVSKIFEINGAKDTLIFKIGGLALGNDSTFFLSDMIDYRIKLFDSNGIYESSFGGKGTSVGNFEKSPYRLAYDYLAKRLAVFEHSSNHIKIFDQKYNQLNEIILQAPISELQFDNESNLITAYSFAPQKINYINFWDTKGNSIFSFNLVNLTGNGLLDMIKFSFNKYNNKIIVAYLYRNLIQVYDKNGHLEKQFSLPFLPEQSETKIETLKTPVGTMQNEIPLFYMFHSISTDNKGKIYLLAGHYSDGGEKKRIYVVNIDGKLLNRIELGTNAIKICIDDDNNLYTISESQNVITKYRINEK
jgi:hypothetical protein